MSEKETTFQEQWNELVNIPEMLLSLGEDLDREGLQETPRRVHRAWLEFLHGYTLKPEEILAKTFDSEGRGIQVCRDIKFTSMCEHHMLPFHGKATIVYQPNERVCGLSKLARLVECFGQRLQIQERMAQEICDAMMTHLAPQGVLVIIEAAHFCAVGRGVKQESMSFVTSAQGGTLDMALVSILLSRKGQ